MAGLRKAMNGWQKKGPETSRFRAFNWLVFADLRES